MVEKKCSNCIGHNTWEKTGKCNGMAKNCDKFKAGKAFTYEEWEDLANRKDDFVNSEDGSMRSRKIMMERQRYLSGDEND